jgi:dimethylhistidine N-methyltransferase
MNHPNEQFFISQTSNPQADEITEGLGKIQAELAPKYFYDELGSELFKAITLLDEYYPPKIEAGIFTRYAKAMAEWFGPFDCLVDIGAADGKKAQTLFAPFNVKRYKGVDISGDFLRKAVDQLQREHPAIEMQAVVQDFSAGLVIDDAEKKLFFYPGSSLGNFTPEQAVQWLTVLRKNPGAQGLILGIDLVKPKAILDAAYADALGVTAAFNLNALRHVNRIVGSDFDPSSWAHLGYFNEALSRVEMHVAAKHDLVVTWPGGQRQFLRGQTIHTESSYKYTEQSIVSLLRAAGFNSAQCFTDTNKWFAVVCAKA